MAAVAQFMTFGPFFSGGNLVTAPKLYHYVAGTLTLKNVYTTRTMSTTAAQPIVGDAEGIVSGFFHGLYKIVIKTSAGDTLYTWDNADFTLADASVNVKDYGAVGDGTTSDQTAIVDAVAAAYAATNSLYWPVGTYLTTATVTNFHDVRHIGPGTITRGSDVFYPDPSMHPGVTNILYVATTGSDTNDGLSSSQPFLTGQAVGDALMKYPWNLATWKFQFAAGTYVGVLRWEAKQFPTVRRVEFLGAPVSTGTAPTTIFDSPGGAQTGFYVKHFQNIYIEDIKFTDFATSGTASGSGTSTGILADSYTNIFLKNVWATNCDTGIQASSFSYLLTEAGIVDACGVGVQVIFHTRISLGYNGSAYDPNGITGTVIKNCTLYGVQIQETCTGHTDYTYFSNNVIALYVVVNSRTHSVDAAFINNTTAIRAFGGVFWYGTNPTFSGNGTNWELGKDVSIDGTGSEVYQTSELKDSCYDREMILQSTQETTPGVTFFTRDFVAQEFGFRQSGFELYIVGTTTGTANTKVVVIKLGGVTLLTATIGSTVTAYTITLKLLVHTGANSSKVVSTIQPVGASPTLAYSTVTTVNLDNAQTLDCTHYVTNAADTNHIQFTELKMYH